MFFNWHGFWARFRFLLTVPGRAKAAIVLGAGLRLSMVLVNKLLWASDDVFMPRKPSAELSPVFILGHQRSGTTLLHNVLLARGDTWGFRFWELLFPSHGARCLARLIGLFAKVMPLPLRQWLYRWRHRLWGRLDPLHYFDPLGYEEEEFFFWGMCASRMCVQGSSATAGEKSLKGPFCRETFPPAVRRKLWNTYRAAVIKKQQTQQSRTFVAKNPAFARDIPELLAVFPKARFVYLIRNPLEAIPSRLSLVESIHRLGNASARLSRNQIKDLVDDSIEQYLAAENHLARIPGARVRIVAYEELLRDPDSVGVAVLGRIEDPGAHKAGSRSRPSQHRYSLEQFGLCVADIHQPLRAVFERYELSARVGGTARGIAMPP